MTKNTQNKNESELSKMRENYFCCPYCLNLPEILNFNEQSNEIKFKCKEHGEININLHECLKKSTQTQEDISDNSSNICTIHNNEKIIYYCLTCDSSLCLKCYEEQINNHSSHNIFRNDNLLINNDELKSIKSKKDLFIDEKNKLFQKIEELNDKIKFYDYLINSYNKRASNSYLLNINIKHLLHGEKLEICDKGNMNNNNQHLNNLNGNNDYEKYYEFIKANSDILIKDETKLSLLNKKLEINTVSQIFKEIKNSNIVNTINKLTNKTLDSDYLSFNKLTLINLRGNNLNSLEFFIGVELPNLSVLSLTENKIESLIYLKNINLPSIKELYLSKNKISSIDVFGELSLRRLQILWISHNNINNIDILNKVRFPMIQILSLSNNNIVNIQVFEKTKFPQLKQLYINENNINYYSQENLIAFQKLYDKIQDFNY